MSEATAVDSFASIIVVEIASSAALAYDPMVIFRLLEFGQGRKKNPFRRFASVCFHSNLLLDHSKQKNCANSILVGLSSD
jgi:hypothetical protein